MTKKIEENKKKEPTNEELLNAIAVVAIKLDTLIDIMDKVATLAETKAKGEATIGLDDK